MGGFNNDDDNNKDQSLRWQQQCNDDNMYQSFVCVCVDLASAVLGLSHNGLSSHRAVLPAPLGAAVNKG